MRKNLRQANRYAWNSVSANQNIRVVRLISRKLYQNMAENWATENYVHDEMGAINTYPWPYSDPKFADWEEDDSLDHYTLISDPSGFAIKDSTSYCAWKIREFTGQWPKRPNQHCSAKNWEEFLAYNGYVKKVERPVDDHHFVGIDPDGYKECGKVVWFHMNFGAYTIVSTYLDHRYVWDERANYNDYTWIQIS